MMVVLEDFVVSFEDWLSSRRCTWKEFMNSAWMFLVEDILD